LQDGTPLKRVESAPPPSFDPDATLVTPVSHHDLPPRHDPPARNEQPAHNEPPPPDFSNSQPSRATPVHANIPTISSFTPPRTSHAPAPAMPTEPRRSNKALIVGLTGMVAMLLLALSGIAFWFLTRDNGNQTNNARVADNQNRTPPANNNRPNVVNANVVSANVNSSPTPAPSLAPASVAAIKEQVTATLNGWVASTRARDMDGHMNYYADKLDTYYNAKNVDASRVEADRNRAFSLYDKMDAQLSNIQITPDPSGERATAIYDKTWTFEGPEKYSSGSVQQKMWLAKIEGRWRIIGEKDLQVYYVNK
jgi:ketosteroid isomerase-like protein